ncbi:MAG TPA: hypothetical protein VIB48_03570 [Acidimicrobiia bacterium]
MGCCLFTALVAAGPRVALALVWLFTNLVSRAFSTFVVPLLGLVFLPWTTLFYVLAYRPAIGISGFGYVFVGLGVVFDLLAWGSGARARAQRARPAY